MSDHDTDFQLTLRPLRNPAPLGARLARLQAFAARYLGLRCLECAAVPWEPPAPGRFPVGEALSAAGVAEVNRRLGRTEGGA